MDDGNNGGQYYISINGMKTNLLSSKASGCFILVGLTGATGELLLCFFILPAKILSATDFKGFNKRTYIPYESSKTMEEKCERSRHFLGCQSASSGGN